MSLTAEEILNAYKRGWQLPMAGKPTESHREGLAAVLGRISQWAREEEVSWSPRRGEALERSVYGRVAVQLDALRSALMGEPQG